MAGRRQRRFTFVANDHERQTIARVAQALQRSESDAARFLFERAAHRLGMGSEASSAIVDVEASQAREAPYALQRT